MIAGKRITALAIFLRGCNQSNPSSVWNKNIKKNLFQIILLFSLKKTYYFGLIMRIAIAGNIGAGKTSLTKQLSKSLKYRAYYEDVISNPYLDDFYNHMERWSFNLQIYFLNSRFKQLVSIDNSKENVIQDRTIYEDAFIFAPNLNSMGLMPQRDYENYLSLFDTMLNLVKPPDLLVYLQSSIPNLVNKIHKRGRDYEKSISIEYLSRLNERYEAWITNYDSGKLLKINVDDIDFVENKSDYETILKLIKKEL